MNYSCDEDNHCNNERKEPVKNWKALVMAAAAIGFVFGALYFLNPAAKAHDEVSCAMGETPLDELVSSLLASDDTNVVLVYRETDAKKFYVALVTLFGNAPVNYVPDTIVTVVAPSDRVVSFGFVVKDCLKDGWTFSRENIKRVLDLAFGPPGSPL